MSKPSSVMQSGSGTFMYASTPTDSIRFTGSTLSFGIPRPCRWRCLPLRRISGNTCDQPTCLRAHVAARTRD